MTREEICALLAGIDTPQKGCGAVNTLLDAHIGHVEVRIEELRALKAQLMALRARCQAEPSSADCGIVRGLTELNIQKRTRRTHLG